MCVAGGYAAGKQVADYVRKDGFLEQLNPEEVKAEKERIFEALQRRKGIFYFEFEEIVRHITTDHFGSAKTEISLKTAIDKLTILDVLRRDMRAGNLHELMWVHEAITIQEITKVTVSAAR
jgi:succinate dehydrogenase/fumarate reductase flavoprotein subunit